MKNFSDIQALLDRYWEGETTLEEERVLKAYFASGQVDERLHAIAPLFQALHEEQSVQYAKTKVAELRPAVVHFVWQKLAAAASVALLLAAGWWWTSKETPVSEQVVQQQTFTVPQPAVPPEKIVEPENSKAEPEKAAPPVLAKKTYPKRKKPATAKPLNPETEEAMEEIKAALALVSSKIRKGREEAAKGAVHLENVDKIFKKKTEG